MDKQQAFNKIKQIVEGNEDNKMNFVWGDDDYLDLDSVSEEDSNLFKDRVVKDSYGGEDEGSSLWAVWYFPSVDLYIEAYGYYASHDGGYYEGMQIVEPKEILKTVYSPVKN